MKTEKEIWIEEVMNSADTMQRVEASAHLFAGVRSRLNGKVVQLEQVSTRTVWLAAASIALLLALNISALSFSSSPKHNTGHSSELTENSFDIYSTN